MKRGAREGKRGQDPLADSKHQSVVSLSFGSESGPLDIGRCIGTCHPSLVFPIQGAVRPSRPQQGPLRSSSDRCVNPPDSDEVMSGRVIQVDMRQAYPVLNQHEVCPKSERVASIVRSRTGWFDWHHSVPAASEGLLHSSLLLVRSRCAR